MTSSEERLRASIRRLRANRGSSPGAPLSTDPTNAFEVAVAERLAHLQSDLDRLQSRLNWLLTVIVGAAVTNVVLALLT